MDVLIESDEAYPFYRLDSKAGVLCSADQDTVFRWRLVMAAYEQVQHEMQAVYEEQCAKERAKL